MTSSFSPPRLAALSLALGAAFPAVAQTSASTFELRETVVTANRSEQLLTEALPHTTVIGREARGALADQPLPALSAEVRQRIAFADSVAAGRLVREIDDDSPAAREIAALAAEVLRSGQP